MKSALVALVAKVPLGTQVEKLCFAASAGGSSRVHYHAKLTQARDLLFPRLMNGEIAV